MYYVGYYKLLTPILCTRPQKLTIKVHACNDIILAAMIITRGISLTNFAVASSALAFQVFVLYPWHKQLDDNFEALKKEHLRLLHKIDTAGFGQPKGIRE